MWLHAIHILKRWPMGCLLFCVMSCHNAVPHPAKESTAEDIKTEKAFKIIYDTKSSVQSGDLVLRTGRDFTSDVMRRLSREDPTYSHCGIASWENDTLFVYHSIGGEWNPDQKIRRDTFAFFCNPYENRGFGIYRYDITEMEKEKLVQSIRGFYSEEIIFDIKFDLQTDDKMYCSELIYKAFKRSVNEPVTIKTTTLNNIEFIAIDDLYKNAGGLQIKKVKFLQ